MKIQQGYIVYQIPAEEIVKLREADCFGNLCDSCNQTIEDTYYIPVLNWGMCKKCFDEWKETAIFYKEDTDFEELNIHWIEKWCDRLNISMTNTTFGQFSMKFPFSMKLPFYRMILSKIKDTTT